MYQECTIKKALSTWCPENKNYKIRSLGYSALPREGGMIFNIQHSELSINLMCLVTMRQSSWLWSILDGMSRTKTSLKCTWYTIKADLLQADMPDLVRFFCCVSVGNLSPISDLTGSLTSTFANEKSNSFLVRLFWTTCVHFRANVSSCCCFFVWLQCWWMFRIIIAFSHNNENILASSLMSVFCLDITSFMLLLLYFPYYIETVEDIDHCRRLHRIEFLLLENYIHIEGTSG